MFYVHLKLRLVAMGMVLCASCFAQNKYGLKTIGYNEYIQSLEQSTEKELVNLETYIPGLLVDVRYATSNNFTGEKIYTLARAYARRPVAQALRGVERELNANGYGLKIFDGYRPYSATVKFYETYHDTTFVASPYSGSKHNRGCALDLTLIKKTSGKELKMPTAYDAFLKDASPTFPVKNKKSRNNRDLLIWVMENMV
ncbi:MAG: M15 family metallopeptidase [Flammeovirgaceae bacterium]|nr:M15 family metallopeptidase [Flammeovirgaceae bacterium]